MNPDGNQPKPWRPILWKTYFWVILVMSAISYVSVGFGRVWEFLDLIIFTASMVGLYSLAWHKRTFSAEFWKSFLISFVIWNIYYLYFVPLPEKVSESTDMSQTLHVTVNSIPFIPLYTALYLYAFRRDPIWKGHQ